MKYLAYILPLAVLASCQNSTKTESNGSVIAVDNVDGNPTSTTEISLNEKKSVDGKSTSVEFEVMEHAFGNVVYPSENPYTFKFKNTGSEPLTVVSATASCGCTVPEKPEEPILPGETGEIEVVFRPKVSQQGTQVRKKVTLVANTEPRETYLYITANVLKSMSVDE